MPKIFILNGPNLNLLGTREPEIYGTDTLQDVENMCQKTAQNNGFEIDFRQSNHEGVLIDWIQEAVQEQAEGMIINAAGYTHTSVSIHDALKMLSCPIVEVHFSDPSSREEFRHHSFITPLAKKVIKGQGAQGYTQAIEFIAKGINN